MRATLGELGLQPRAALLSPLVFRGSNVGLIEAFDRVDGPEFRVEDERLCWRRRPVRRPLSPRRAHPRTRCARLDVATTVELEHGAVTRESRLEPDVEIAIYRTVQESLTNAAKHAGARSVEVVVVARGDGPDSARRPP